jgi:type III pantothenate kinase
MMAVLLIDIGNTRIKWASFNGGRLGKSRAKAHAGWKAGDFRRQLFGARKYTRVWATSVAGENVDQALAQTAHQAGIRATFVRTPRRGGGVTVGYPEPWRLGVDRYVAMVGAHQLFSRLPVLIVGVGTAMTIDLVGADGRHRGGVIIPGPQLMVDTLLTKTHGIKRRAQGGAKAGKALFGRSTKAAIVQGSRYAAAALIDRAVEEARPLVGRKPLVLLMGGDAASVRPLLNSACVGVPDLVLRGLAALAEAATPSRGSLL